MAPSIGVFGLLVPRTIGPRPLVPQHYHGRLVPWIIGTMHLPCAMYHTWALCPSGRVFRPFCNVLSFFSFFDTNVYIV